MEGQEASSGQVQVAALPKAVLACFIVRFLTGPHTEETFLSGLELYRERLDKGYSLTDCISTQIMRREKLTEVLTSDRHFEQEGFRALFRA